jgi:hypothetical protein
MLRDKAADAQRHRLRCLETMPPMLRDDAAEIVRDIYGFLPK